MNANDGRARWCPQVLAASVAGPGHNQHGLPCQDAHAWEWLPDGTLVLAVADGAGSARKSEIGAQSAVQGAIASAKAPAADTRTPNGDPLDDLAERLLLVFRGARSAVEAVAQLQREPLRELATTLLVCLWTENGVVSGHVGDGAAIGWLGKDAGFKILSAPAATEYVNETAFITEPDWECKFRVTAMPGYIPGVLLTTDGCQRAALRRKKPEEVSDHEGCEVFGPFVSPILDYVHRTTDAVQGQAELATLLCSEKLAGHSDDDKTLVALRADRWCRRTDECRMSSS